MIKINSSEISDLDSSWDKMCAGLLPIAHNLKVKLKSSWLRFHYLPDSKRYPETSDEMNEIKNQHNIWLKELCRENEEIFVLTSPSSFDFEIISGIPISTIDSKSAIWKSVKVENEDEMEFDVYFSTCNYAQGVVDDILEKVANDEIWNVMIIDKCGNWIYHPYDGGCDIFTNNIEQLKSMAAKYSDWLPKNDHGL